MAEIEFNKYQKKGAYHWREVEGGLREINAYTLGRYEIVLRLLAERNIGRGHRILDVGCGDGALSGLIHRRLAADLVGIDPEEVAVDLARGEFKSRGWNGEFIATGAYETGLPSDSFDAAVSADVIEHVREPDRLLAEAKRVLKPGGIFIVTTPLRISEKPVDPLHVQEWFASEFLALCTQSFGPVEATRYSHPTVWYELYRAFPNRFGQLLRCGVNLAARKGRNPFLDPKGRWALMTQQAVVLRKGA